MLLAKLTSRELAGKVFDEIKNNNSSTSIATIDAELTVKLVRRRYLYSVMAARKMVFLTTESANKAKNILSARETTRPGP